jgi:succinate dehydrogenase / fumarate reductase cytochrome b subunit
MSSWTDKRPMSPHFSVWRWHVTMLGSILHRVTGCALYAGAILVVGWLFAMTFGPERYGEFAAIVASIPGQVILFGFTLSVVYHALNGIRHLFWDTGHGFNPGFASFTGWLVIVLSIVGAVAIWIAAGLVPGVDPLGLAGSGSAQ